MRYIILLFIIFLFNSIIIPQESVLLKFGNGTSSLSDFSVQVQNGNESFQIDIKRLRSNLRDLNFQFDDTFNNEIVKLILKLASASADGAHCVAGVVVTLKCQPTHLDPFSR